MNFHHQISDHEQQNSNTPVKACIPTAKSNLIVVFQACIWSVVAQQHPLLHGTQIWRLFPHDDGSMHGHWKHLVFYNPQCK